MYSGKFTEERQTTSKTCTYTDTRNNMVEITLAAPRKYVIKSENIFLMAYLHSAALYGVYLCLTTAALRSVVFAYCLYIIGGLGITAGAHRLWTHRSYKAKPPLEFFIMILNCIALQYTVINWVRDHRLHHKHSDTDADPHNARRGFFYSHIGWLLVKKNDLVREREKTIDISDVENNPILKFQKKYAIFLFGTASIILPTVIPIWCWGETLSNAWHLNVLRYVVNLNASLLVNSAAHIYGNKPYDANILPAQNSFVSYMTVGEGFHNFHHVFPSDYRTAELGQIFYYNVTTSFIDLCAWLGLAYDLKTANPEIVDSKSDRSGDGTRFSSVKKSEW